MIKLALLAVLLPGILVFYSPSFTKACLISHKTHKLEEVPWTHVEPRRKVDQSCVCGETKKNDSKPWNVYIHAKTNGKENATICTGTILTNNLVATSHSCLLLTKRKFNLYDTWKPKEGEANAVYDLNDVKISTSIDINLGTSITLQDIIYNSQYAVNSALNVYPPRYDMVLLLVSELSFDDIFRPICLPLEKDFENLDVDDIEALYYGFIDKSRHIPDVHIGTVRDNKYRDCLARLRTKSFSVQYNLCFWFSTNGPTPIVEGGPLYVETEKSFSFLMGIASVLDSVDDETTEFILFSSVFRYPCFDTALIKYVEEMAETYHSKWCQTSTKFSVKKRMETRTGRENGGNKENREVYSWELEGSTKQRDESLDCVCGLPNDALSGRVVGGEAASRYEFPWMTLIKIFVNGRGKNPSLCGGTIINDRMILTAAHCVVMNHKLRKNQKPKIYPLEDFEVHIKVHQRGGDDDDSIEKDIQAIFFHPLYAIGRLGGYWDHDVALIVLKDPMKFDSNLAKGLRPICLLKIETPYRDFVGEYVIVAGWGMTDPDDTGSTASILQKLEIPISPRSLCSDLLDTYSQDKSIVTETNICGGTLDRNKDAARGDSGGPLMFKEGRQYTQVGIVSWGEDVNLPGGEIKTAALYSDVQLFKEFINYHATTVKAKWCRASLEPENVTSAAVTQPSKGVT